MIRRFHEKELDEKFISNKKVFSGRLLKVEMDTVLLPDGSKTTREFIRHPGAVAVVPVLDDGRIVLVKQCRYPMDTVMWEIPAGKLDHGQEEPESCAKRELSEETGYEAEYWQKLVAIATTPAFTDEVIYLYKAWGLKKFTQHTDEDEFIGIAAFYPQQIKQMILNGEIFDAKTLCALYACELVK